MAKDGVIEVEGQVVEALPNAMFRVELEQAYRARNHLGQDEEELYSHSAAGSCCAGNEPL